MRNIKVRNTSSEVSLYFSFNKSHIVNQKIFFLTLRTNQPAEGSTKNKAN